MTVPVSINKTFRIDTKSYAENRNLSAAAELQRDANLGAAKTGTLTTRTNNTDGTLTMSAGHGITTGAKIALFWAGGCRRNVTVGTVATNSVPISGGAGDNLPIATTPITAMVETIIEFRVDGDDLVALAASSPVPHTAWFSADDNTEVPAATFSHPYAGQSNNWNNQNGVANPLAGVTVTRAHVAHGDSTGTKTVQVGAAFN